MLVRHFETQSQMDDSNAISCPFNPSDQTVSLRNFGWTLFETFRQHSASVALVDVASGRDITYEELEQKAETLAQHLLRIGLSTGDVIGIFSANSIEWLIVIAAAFRIGATIAGIDCLSRAGELEQQLCSCKANVLYASRETAAIALQTTEGTSCQVIVNGGYRQCIDLESLFQMTDKLPELPTTEQLNVKPDDHAVIMFSSGTTGTPKAIILTHYNVQAMVVMLSHPETGAVYPQQLVTAPLSHASGFITAVTGLAMGYNTLILQRFDFRVFLKCIQDYKLERVFIVSPIANLLAKSPMVNDYRLGHLKGINSGAASLSSNIEAVLMERFPGLTIQQCYGMTETFGPICAVPAVDRSKGRKPGSVGVPLVNVRVKVVDIESGKSLGPSQRGEICVKAATNSSGYMDNPEATKALIDKDGWIHTGDVGYFDEDGYFFIVDRLKELIKYNSYQVAPAELEGVLMSHTQVLDAGVYSLPDPQAGELPAACVVLRPGSKATELELQQFVSDRVAPYKRLRGGIEFVAAIPKSASGKILRRRIREENMLNGKL